MINDWHYEIAHATPVLFASKGYNVIACPWNKANVAVNQVEMMKFLRENSSPEMSKRYMGVMHTFWGPARMFMAGMSGVSEFSKDGSIETFKKLVEIW